MSFVHAGKSSRVVVAVLVVTVLLDEHGRNGRELKLVGRVAMRLCLSEGNKQVERP